MSVACFHALRNVFCVSVSLSNEEVCGSFGIAESEKLLFWTFSEDLLYITHKVSPLESTKLVYMAYNELTVKKVTS